MRTGLADPAAAPGLPLRVAPPKPTAGPAGTGTVSGPAADGDRPGRSALRVVGLGRPEHGAGVGCAVLGGGADDAGGGRATGNAAGGRRDTPWSVGCGAAADRRQSGTQAGARRRSSGSRRAADSALPTGCSRSTTCWRSRGRVRHLASGRPCACTREAPLAGRGSGDGNLLTAVEGLAARKSVRQIACEIHGVDAVPVTDWDPDSDVRAQVRRLVKKARFLMRGGYLELASGRRPRL